MTRAIFGLIALAMGFAEASAAEITVPSRVEAVTVFPSGAEVTRAAEFPLQPGEHVILLDGLPSDLDISSLRAEGEAEGGLTIGPVDLNTVSVPQADTAAERRQIEEQIKALEIERATIAQAVQDGEFERRLLESLIRTDLTTARRQPDGAAALGVEGVKALLDLAAERVRNTSAAKLAAQTRDRGLGEQIEELRAKLEELAPRQVDKTVASIQVSADAAGKATLKVRYNVGSASWTPVYDARLETIGEGAPKLDLARRAQVAQGSGEAWTDVALTLSTARPSGATAAPELHAQAIEVLPDDDEEQKAAGAAPGASWDDTVEMAEPRAAPSPPARLGYARRIATESSAQQEIAGFQALYRIAGKQTVENTGASKSVLIGMASLPVKLSARSVPKVDARAYLTAELTVQGESPLLPGEVRLFRDGVFVGGGALPLLSPGEEHELGFGADDRIKVERKEAGRRAGETGLISTANVEERTFVTTLKSLHEKPVEVTVEDQMPFSTHEDVKVELMADATAASTEDVDRRRGVQAWTFTLEPGEEKVITLAYRVSWPKEMKVFAPD